MIQDWAAGFLCGSIKEKEADQRHMQIGGCEELGVGGGWMDVGEEAFRGVAICCFCCPGGKRRLLKPFCPLNWNQVQSDLCA